MKTNAFTLAEVLVTLMIIAVIAAMTVPPLKRHAQEQETVARVKKAYSTIANATRRVEMNHGDIKRLPWGTPTKIMDEMFIPEMNVINNCHNNGGCFKEGYTTRSMNGGANNAFQTDKSWYTFVTADGAYWAYSGIGTCDYNEGTYIKNACGYFEVDINGPAKPNMMGTDIFGFAITKEGVFPFGGCPGCDDSQCDGNSTGWACTAKIIKEGKITW